MEFFTEWTLKISELLNLDRRIRVTQRVIIGIWVRSGINRYHFSDGPNLGPDHSKDNERGTNHNQTQRDQTITPFLLHNFRASFLAFTLLLGTHENSLM